MSISDFINDPFGEAARAVADLAPDSVRETVHEAKETLAGMAQSVADPTTPDANASGSDFTDPNFDLGTYVNEHGIAGPDLKSAAGIIVDDKENWDTNGPMEPSHPGTDSPPSGIIHPDPMADGIAQTAGEQAQGYGAGGEYDGGPSAGSDVFGDAGTLGENSMKNDWQVDIGPAEEAEPDQTAGEQAQYSGADGYWGTSDYGGSAAEEAAGSGVSAYGPGADPNYSLNPVGEDGPAAPDYGPGATGELAGASGEVGATESYSLGENSMQNDWQVDIGPAEEAEPDQTAGEQAQYSGADGYWGTSDYGGSAAEEAAGSGVSGYGPGADPNYSLNPVGEDGPAAPDYGPGATGELAGAGGEVTTEDDSFF
jgi:hypothetical protein